MVIPDSIPTITLDRERYAEVWRLAAYSVANCLITMQVARSNIYQLRPSELLIFEIVALASVQRTVRAVRIFDANVSDIQPSNQKNGTISRRRIADITGIPRATVGRALDRLIDKGMIVEIARGQLKVPVGIVLQGDYACDLEDLINPVIVMLDQLKRLGVVQGVENGSDQREAIE